MANYTQQPINPLINTPTVNQQSLLSIGSQVVSSAAQNTQENMSQFDMLRRNAYRQQLQTQEAQHQAALGQKETDLKINDTMLNTIGHIAAIDNEKQREIQKQTDTSYLTNATLSLQTNYMQFVDQANKAMSANGAGYTASIQKHINDTIEGLVQNAPSEDARNAIINEGNHFKLNAVVNAFQTEQKARTNYNLAQVGAGVDQVIRQVSMQPEQTDALLPGLDKVAESLKSFGYGQNQINEYMNSAMANIRATQIDSLNNTGQASKSMELLQNQDIAKLYSTKDYIKHMDETYKAGLKSAGLSLDRATAAIDMNAFINGTLNAGDKNYNQIADAHFKEFKNNILGDTSIATPDQIPQLSSALGTYLKQYSKQEIAPQFKGYLESSLLSSKNPSEVVIAAKAINAASQDPTNGSLGLMKSLSKDTIMTANIISNLTSAGMGVNDAVETAREQINQAKNQPETSFYASQLKQVTEDDVASMLKSVKDGWFHFFPKDSANQYLGNVKNIYTAQLAQYKDPKLAEEATKVIAQGLYRETKVNGDRQVMEAAPEMYYDENTMKDFQSQLLDNIQSYAKNAGWKDNGDGTFNDGNVRIKPEIRSIPGVTIDQSLNNKQYLLVNGLNGMNIKDKDLRPQSFTFQINQSKYQNLIKIYNENLQNQRNELNKLHDSVVSNWSNTAKNALEAYMTSVKRGDLGPESYIKMYGIFKNLQLNKGE